MPFPMYMDRMMDGMEGYMESRNQYNRGNYGAKGQTVESLEKMLEGIVAFVEDIQQDPEQKEEKPKYVYENERVPLYEGREEKKDKYHKSLIIHKNFPFGF